MNIANIRQHENTSKAANKSTKSQNSCKVHRRSHCAVYAYCEYGKPKNSKQIAKTATITEHTGSHRNRRNLKNHEDVSHFQNHKHQQSAEHHHLALSGCCMPRQRREPCRIAVKPTRKGWSQVKKGRGQIKKGQGPTKKGYGAQKRRGQIKKGWGQIKKGWGQKKKG